MVNFKKKKKKKKMKTRNKYLASSCNDSKQNKKLLGSIYHNDDCKFYNEVLFYYVLLE